MTDQLILLQLKQLPEDLRQEVLNYMGYLLLRYKKNSTPNTPVNGSQQPAKGKSHKYRGALTTKLTVEEIDLHINSLR